MGCAVVRVLYLGHLFVVESGRTKVLPYMAGQLTNRQMMFQELQSAVFRLFTAGHIFIFHMPRHRVLDSTCFLVTRRFTGLSIPFARRPALCPLDASIAVYYLEYCNHITFTYKWKEKQTNNSKRL